jgi:hypothetical protein
LDPYFATAIVHFREEAVKIKFQTPPPAGGKGEAFTFYPYSSILLKGQFNEYYSVCYFGTIL